MHRAMQNECFSPNAKRIAHVPNWFENREEPNNSHASSSLLGSRVEEVVRKSDACQVAEGTIEVGELLMYMRRRRVVSHVPKRKL